MYKESRILPNDNKITYVNNNTKNVNLLES